MAACSTATPPASPPAPVLAKNLQDGWLPNEQIRVVGSQSARTGVTPDGFSYRIYRDGSAAIESSPNLWSLDCTKDAMTDVRECTIYSTQGNNRLFLTFDRRGEPSVACVMGHDFPRRTAAIRIDAKAPVPTSADGCIPAGRVLPDLLAGSTVTTRKVHWPYDYPVDETGSLSGLSRAVDLARFITNTPKILAF